MHCFLDFPFLLQMELPVTMGFCLSAMQNFLQNIYFSHTPLCARERNPFFKNDSFKASWLGRQCSVSLEAGAEALALGGTGGLHHLLLAGTICAIRLT